MLHIVFYHLKKEANSLCRLLKTNSGDFYTRLISNEQNKLSFKEKPILQFFDINLLIDILFNESGYCRYYLGGLLEDRYTDPNYNKYLISELDFLLELKKNINKKLISKKGKVSAYNVKKDLVEQLNKAINDLQTIKKKVKLEIH